MGVDAQPITSRSDCPCGAFDTKDGNCFADVSPYTVCHAFVIMSIEAPMKQPASLCASAVAPPHARAESYMDSSCAIVGVRLVLAALTLHSSQ